MKIQDNDIYKRIARLEAVSAKAKSDMDDILAAAYKNACDENNEEEAAAIARKIRNKLLYESDKEFIVDKMLGDAPVASDKSQDWVKWLKTVVLALKNEWAVYRQNLRDLPEQEGFPFNVDFPVSPDAKGNKETPEI